MINFGDWKDKEFNCIYKRFEQTQNMQIKHKEEQFLKTLERHPNVQPPNKSGHRLHSWRRDYLAGLIYGDTKINIEVPCMSCGQATKNRNNHTFSQNMIDEYLSEDGHVYGFQMDPRRDEQTEIAEGVSSDQASDADIWIFRGKKLKEQGVEKTASIFWGFCWRCDDKIFKNADTSLYKKEKQAILEQMYRVLCSTYYMSLDHAVKLQYIIKKEEEFGFRVGEYSIVTRWKNTFTGKNMGSIDNSFRVLLNKSHKFYNFMVDFKKALSSPDRVIYRCDVIKVKTPSVVGSFFLIKEGRVNKEINGIIRPIDSVGALGLIYPISQTETVYCKKINGIIQAVDSVGALGLIYPISKTETVYCVAGIPSGVGPFDEDVFSRYRDVKKNKGIKIALSQILLENYTSIKNLFISPAFYRSLSEKEKNAIYAYPYTDEHIRQTDNLPEVNVYEAELLYGQNRPQNHLQRTF